ncbi:unnamed protein product [Urochloa humidicola]
MESSGSASNREFPDGLPLIWCTDCGRRKIVKRASKQEWSMGQIFYCFPNYKRDGTGCPFWFWEEEYVKVLQNKGVAIPAQVADLTMPVANPRPEGAIPRHEGVESRRQEGVVFTGTVSMKEGNDLVAIGKEILSVVKGICFVCVWLLFVMLGILLVLLFK